MATFSKEKFRKVRTLRGLSMEQVALRAGYAERTLRLWEAGQTRNPRPEAVLAVAQVLKVEPAALYEDEAPTEPRLLAHLALETASGTTLQSRRVFDREITIGHSPENWLSITDPRVSSIHAMLRIEGQEVTVRDLGSRHGTWIAGERVSEKRIPFGVPIGIRGYVVRLHPPSSLPSAASTVLPES